MAATTFVETAAAPAAVAVNGTTTTKQLAFHGIPECIEAFARGEFLIVLDGVDRENEGDLIISAAHLTPAKAAFMIRYTSGYLCVPMPVSRAAALDLPPMLPPSGTNEDPKGTAYTIPVDAAAAAGHNITTGISAHDRSVTCRLLANGGATRADFRRPGHVVPLLVRQGGVRVRTGHTEATWEFCRLAGFEPAVGVIGEMVLDGQVVRDRGEGEGAPEFEGSGMMRRNDCLEFGRRWGIRCCTIEDLVAYVEMEHGEGVQLR